MYVYLIQYHEETIAVADDMFVAEAVIQQYLQKNKDMDVEQFDITPVRFFSKEDYNDTQDQKDEG